MGGRENERARSRESYMSRGSFKPPPRPATRPRGRFRHSVAQSAFGRARSVQAGRRWAFGRSVGMLVKLRGDDRYWDRTWPSPRGYEPFMTLAFKSESGHELWVGGPESWRVTTATQCAPSPIRE